MISVESTDDALLVRIPYGEISEQRVMEMLRDFQVERIFATSKMTEEEADAMAEEMKADWWERNKERFLPKSVLEAE
jgi:hypothetical protein